MHDKFMPYGKAHRGQGVKNFNFIDLIYYKYRKKNRIKE
jgi:hypothetical protein